MKKKLLMVSTVPATLNFFSGQIQFLKKDFDIELVGLLYLHLQNS